VLGGVIFDFDGVLVDSERAHFEALRAALGEDGGFEISFAEYTERYLAFDDRGGIRRALEAHATDASPFVVERVARRKASLFEEALPRIPLLPGAAELVSSLHDADVPLAIASGARRSEIEALLSGRGLLHLFRGIVAAEDVTRFKPHPEPYERGLALIRPSGPENRVIAFEDSLPGIESALAAGLRVVAVANSLPRERLGSAHRVSDSLAEWTVEEVRRLSTSGS